VGRGARSHCAEGDVANWEGLPGHQGLDRYSRSPRSSGISPIVNRGDAPAAMRGAAKIVFGDLLLALPEPCIARPVMRLCRCARRMGARRFWSASQGRTVFAPNLARVFGLPPDKMRVIFLDGSGSYGTNGTDHVAADALLLSKTVGQPVRVQ